MRPAMAQERRASRLGFVDAARGLAVVLMLQTHAYDAWLRPELRQTSFFSYSQLIGGLPGAFFLFLLGVSSALASDAARAKGATGAELVRRGLRRSAEIFFYAYAFRAAMYLVSDRPQIDTLFRVDILNCLAASSAFLTVLDRIRARSARIFGAAAFGLWFAIAASFVWDGGLVDGLPERVAGYLSGRVPNTIFPIFPWAFFAFAGHAAGDAIGAARSLGMDVAIRRLGVAGFLLMPLSMALDTLPTIGPKYDYWYTSPNFVMFKAGVLTLLVVAAYYLERWRQGLTMERLRRVLDPVSAGFIQMGQTSLFIYCVHVDLVYGSKALPKLWRSSEISEASRNLLLLTLAMLALSYVWVWLKAQVGAKLAARRA